MTGSGVTPPADAPTTANQDNWDEMRVMAGTSARGSMPSLPYDFGYNSYAPLAYESLPAAGALTALLNLHSSTQLYEEEESIEPISSVPPAQSIGEGGGGILAEQRSKKSPAARFRERGVVTPSLSSVPRLGETPPRAPQPLRGAAKASVAKEAAARAASVAAASPVPEWDVAQGVGPTAQEPAHGPVAPAGTPMPGSVAPPPVGAETPASTRAPTGVAAKPSHSARVKAPKGAKVTTHAAAASNVATVDGAAGLLALSGNPDNLRELITATMEQLQSQRRTINSLTKAVGKMQTIQPTTLTMDAAPAAVKASTIFFEEESDVCELPSQSASKSSRGACRSTPR